jgi:hypothetical protein
VYRADLDLLGAERVRTQAEIQQAREMTPEDRVDELLRQIQEILAFRGRAQRAYRRWRDDIKFSHRVIQQIEGTERRNNIDRFVQFHAECQNRLPNEDNERKENADPRQTIAEIIHREFASMREDQEKFDGFHIP